MLPSRRYITSQVFYNLLSRAGFFKLSETYQSTIEIENFSDAPSYNEAPSETSVSELPGLSQAEVAILAEELGRALEPIMSAHADKVVTCERLGGAKMTLGEAVNAIWPPSVSGAMILEGLPAVMAEIYKMLNSTAEEEPEEKEDDVTPEEDSLPDEAKEPENKPQAEVAKEKPAAKPNTPTEPEEIQRVYSEYSVSSYIEKQAFDRAAFEQAQAADKRILVDIWAPWCPTCRAQEPIIDRVAAARGNESLVVFRVHFDNQKAEVRRFGAQRQSTLIAYRGTRETGRLVADTDPDRIAALVASTR